MQALLDVILPVFLVIGFGYLAVWRGWFSAAGVDGLMAFTQNFAIPCLLFVALARLDLGQSFDWRLLLSFYTGSFIAFLLGLGGARLIFGRPWEDAVVIGFCALFSNSVLLGLPITSRAFGPDALAGNYAIVALHSPFCYGVGITAMEIVRASGRGGVAVLGKVLRAILSNALLIGILAGFAVNISGLTLPGPVNDALDLMVRAALPAALFGLGGVLVQYRPEGDMRTILYVCAISLLVHPLITYGLGMGLGLSVDALRSGVVTAAMAPGVNAYIFANMYGHAKRVAASSVLIATGLTLITAWVWIQVLP